MDVDIITYPSTIVKNNGSLNWRERPPEVLECIQSAFKRISDAPVVWLNKGDNAQEYDLCGIKQYPLMQTIINSTVRTSQRKIFHVLDIGAGQCQWARGLADYIDACAAIPSEIQVNIVSVTGEPYLGERVIKTQKCQLYQFGIFKIEMIFDQLKEFLPEIELENKVDFAVSSWCFKHLVDPVGTFIQTYQLLRPSSGLLLIDDFYLEISSFSLSPTMTHQHFLTQLNTQVFVDTKAPFLRRNHFGVMNQYILQRADDTNCQIPMRYEELRPLRPSFVQKQVVCFERECQNNCTAFYHPIRNNSLSGNQDFYHWLKHNNLLISDRIDWEPLAF